MKPDSPLSLLAALLTIFIFVFGIGSLGELIATFTSNETPVQTKKNDNDEESMPDTMELGKFPMKKASTIEYGKHLYKMGHYDDAINQFRMAQKEYKEELKGQAFYYEGLCRQKQNMENKACELFKQAQRHGYKVPKQNLCK